MAAHGDLCRAHRGRVRARLLSRQSHAAQARCFRALFDRPRREDVRGVLVSALPGAKRRVWRVVRVRSLRGVQHQRADTRQIAGLHRCQDRALSHLAVSADRRTSGARFHSRSAERPDGVSTPVTDLTQRLMSLVALLAVCGIAVSSVSLQDHYATSKTAYCEIGETFNCDIVNRSEYSS